MKGKLILAHPGASGRHWAAIYKMSGTTFVHNSRKLAQKEKLLLQHWLSDLVELFPHNSFEAAFFSLNNTELFPGHAVGGVLIL